MTTPHDEARGHGDGERTTGPPAHDQPVRDDLLEPEEIDPARVDGPTQDAETATLPDPEELPESQGVDVTDAERWTEDASPRRLLADEELEGGEVDHADGFVDDRPAGGPPA